jgi:hypothetical protein
MRSLRLASALLLSCLCTARAGAAQEDLVFVSLQPGAFATLPPQDRLLAYELAQAALAGHRLSYPQRQAQQFVETIYTHFPARSPASLQTRFMETLGRYYAYHAFPGHEGLLTPMEMEDLALGARAAGARFPGVTTLSGLQRLLSKVQGPIFSPGANPPAVRPQPSPLPAELRAVQAHLEAALPLARPAQQAALQSLLASLREGASPPAAAQGAAVDLLLEPGGPAGSGYRALVFLPDAQASAPLHKLAAHLADLAAELPAPYTRLLSSPIDLEAASLLVAAGGDAPLIPAAVRAPGPKVLVFPEVIAAQGRHVDLPLAGALACAPQEQTRAMRHHGIVTRLFAALREAFLILPGAPEPRPGRVLDPAIAQARADLLALWVLGHPRTVQLGVLPQEAVEEVYQAYLRKALLTLREEAPGARARGSALVLHALKDRAQAITLGQTGSALAVCLRDSEMLRQGVTALLSALARMEAPAERLDRGDRGRRRHKVPAPEQALLPDLTLVQALAAQVRTQTAAVPAGVVFLNPEILASRDATGRITAVRIQPGQDFLRQQVGYARSR